MGKSVIVYVVGLAVIIGFSLQSLNRATLDSMDAYSTYFGRTMAHNIVMAGANVGARKLLVNANDSVGFSGAFGGGLYEVAYHSTSPMRRRMRVTSEYAAGGELLRDTISADFEFTLLSRYAWFTEVERNGYDRPDGTHGPFFNASDWKITGDSVFGYAHTNGHFNLAGRPYFAKKVTAMNAANMMPLAGVLDPVFNEGYQWGRHVPRDNADITALRAVSNAGSILHSSYLEGNDVGFEFISDGSVHVLIPWNPLGVPWGTSGAVLDTVLPVTALTSNGVIGVLDGDAHVRGSYRGQVTVAAFKGTGALANKGNIWIDGHVVAADNPAINQNSTDMLGLVAERMGYISRDDTRNPSSVLNIQAAIYCHTGEFTAQDFWNIGIHGRVNLYGSLTQKTAGSLGVFSFGSGLIHGMYYSVRHDSRFLAISPPHFPFSKRLRLVAWWEN
jgi:hypothetical protein